MLTRRCLGPVALSPRPSLSHSIFLHVDQTRSGLVLVCAPVLERSPSCLPLLLLPTGPGSLQISTIQAPERPHPKCLSSEPDGDRSSMPTSLEVTTHHSPFHQQ